MSTFSLLQPGLHEVSDAAPLRTVSDADFRAAMSRFATGVTIVTTRDAKGQPAGFTASSFTSLSRAPPMVLVCLARSAASFGRFVEATEFAVSVLRAGQDDLAKLFASRGADKFTGDHLVAGEHGLPLIRNALVTFECAMDTVTAGGDHVILIGRPLTASVHAGEPMINYAGRLRSLGGD